MAIFRYPHYVILSSIRRMAGQPNFHAPIRPPHIAIATFTHGQSPWNSALRVIRKSLCQSGFGEGEMHSSVLHLEPLPIMGFKTDFETRESNKIQKTFQLPRLVFHNLGAKNIVAVICCLAETSGSSVSAPFLPNDIHGKCHCTISEATE